MTAFHFDVDVAPTWKINDPVVISVNFHNHVLKLRVRRILPQRSHHCAQFTSRDHPCNRWSIQDCFEDFGPPAYHRRFCPDESQQLRCPGSIPFRQLTNSENASLNSLTCSSVSASAPASKDCCNPSCTVDPSSKSIRICEKFAAGGLNPWWLCMRAWILARYFFGDLSFDRSRSARP